MSDDDTKQAEAEEQLRLDWGDDYPLRLADARKLAGQLFTEADLDEPTERGVRRGDDVEVIRDLAARHQRLADISSALGVETGYVDLDARIKAFERENARALFNASDPEHEAAVRQRGELYRARYGDEPIPDSGAPMFKPADVFPQLTPADAAELPDASEPTTAEELDAWERANFTAVYDSTHPAHEQAITARLRHYRRVYTTEES